MSLTPVLGLADAWDIAAEAIEHDPMRPIRYGKCFGYFGDCSRQAKLLEVGCGEGTGLLFATQIGFQNLAGYEISEERLRRATSKLGSEVLLASVDGTGALPFETALFDGAYSTAVIEHTTDPKAFMQEIARVVKPGGVVVISSDCWQWRVLQCLGIYQSAQPIDRAMTTSKLFSLFRATGFEVLHFDGFALPGQEFRFLRMLTTWLWRNPLSARVIGRLKRLIHQRERTDLQPEPRRSIEQEYQIFADIVAESFPRKPKLMRYFASTFSDENVFYLRRK